MLHFLVTTLTRRVDYSVTPSLDRKTRVSWKDPGRKWSRASGSKNTFLEVLEARKNWLDVNNGRAVDGFDGADAQPILDDLAHGNAMEAQRIWPVGRSRRKYARKRKAPIRARMNLEHVAPGAVQPSHNDDVAADQESIKPLCGERTHLKPGVGASSAPCLGALTRELSAERITPIARSCMLLPLFTCVAICTNQSFGPSSGPSSLVRNITQ
jgi:hypothetical protein